MDRLARPAPPLRPLDPRRRPARRRRPPRPSPSEAYEAGVRRIQEYILSGDAFQVVYSQRFQVPRGDVDPFDVYRALRVINPSPYMYHLEFPEAVVTGASPEVLVRLDGGDVEVRPIAGTRRRGANAEEDAALEAELRDRSEGAGRAHDADRPRPQRRRARLGARHGPADGADDGRALLARHAPDVQRARPRRAGHPARATSCAPTFPAGTL